jgi:putative membrane protein
MLYACLAMTGRLLQPADSSGAKWRWSVVAALFLVAWDVSMDPAMVHTAHWTWGSGQQFRDAGLPQWLVAFFTRDAFYGMPLSNWGGWFLTGLVVSRVMLAIMPPSVVAARIAPSRLPIVLYAANGIMPVVLCFRDDLLWAGILGAAAMALPVVLALRKATPATATHPAPGVEPALS